MTLLHILLFLYVWAKLEWMGRRLGQPDFPLRRASASGTAAVLCLLVTPLPFLSPIQSWTALVFLDAALTGLSLMDAWYFRYYGDVLSVSALKGSTQIRRVLPSITALIRPGDFALLLDVAVGVFLYPAIQMSSPNTGPARIYVALALAAAGLATAIPAVRLVAADPEEVFEYVFQRREIVSAIGLLAYHVYDAAAHLTYSLAGRWGVSAEDRKLVANLMATRRRPAVNSGHFGLGSGKNIILISAESLQGFLVGLEFGGHPVAPNLTAFSRECIQFTRFFDQTHLSTTADAEFLALQSLYPMVRGAVATRYPANDFRALPTVLAEHGYLTLSACAEPSDFWNMGQMHPRLGFQQSWFRSAYKDDVKIGVGLADEAFFVQSASRLANIDQPFFAYLITSSAHHPYDLPPTHCAFDAGPLEGTLVGRYLQSVHYFDQAFGRFLDALRDSGVLERSVLVVFGDHQAHLSDQPELPGILAANGRVPPDTRVLSAVQRWKVSKDVPFLIRLPGAASAHVCDSAGGHLDIAPTLLALAGLEDGLGSVMLGRDLLSGGVRPVLFRDGGVATENTVFLRGSDTTFDLATGNAVPAGDAAAAAALASKEFRASDAIIRGNLIPRLLARQPDALRPPPPRATLVIAHRGDSVRAPENTLLAISLAIEAGADAVEVDVRLSQDGVPFILHEDLLDETTNGTGPAADLTMAELKQLDAGSWKDIRFTGHQIPTLEEALAVIRGRGRLLIDVKADGMAAAVAAVYRQSGVATSEAMVGAWTVEQMDEFARHMPDALIMRSNGEPPGWDAKYFERMKASGVRGFEVGDIWPPAFVDAARNADMLVIAYTVNDEGTMRRLIRMGIDGIETDDPALAVRVCREVADSEWRIPPFQEENTADRRE